MPRIPKPLPLSKAEGRRIWLHAQRLTPRAPFGERRGGDAGGGRASGLRADRHDQRHRAVAPPHPLHPHPRLPARRPPAGADRRQDACSNTGRTRSSYVPTRDFRFFIREMRRQRDDPSRWFGAVTGPNCASMLRRLRREGRAHHPRHRRRRAGREGSPLGEPQAVEAGAAARLLPRRSSRSASAAAC